MKQICANSLSHFFQGLKFFIIHEMKFGHKVVEVLVARVDVRLGADRHQPVEVVHVHVHEHAVQAGQDLKKQ